MTDGKRPETVSERPSADSVPGADFGPYVPYAPAQLASDAEAPATLLALLDRAYEAAFHGQPALANVTLEEIRRRVLRVHNCGAADSTMGSRVLEILDGVE